MDNANGIIQFSAGDLVGHLACRHLTALNLDVASGRRAAPKTWDPELKLLRERGLAHEQDYIRHLQSEGREITTVPGVGLDAQTVAATEAAMQAGCDVIVQGALAHGNWGGRPDILSRVETPSRLGRWSYEVIDTKLAQETRGGTVLQLSLYSDLVGSLQGELPEFMYVVSPDPKGEFAPQRYRTNDYAAYYRLVRSHLQEAVAADSQAQTYPEPRPHCIICRWNWETCEPRRRRDDHLCYVAGISAGQMEALRGRGVDTMEGLARLPIPLTWKPERGSPVRYERAREQARVQVERRQTGQPVYETLAPEQDAGLALLPEPAEGDIFFDFEGSPYVGEKGLEYLFGYVWVNESGEERYTGRWALDHAQEKRIFEEFVDWVMARWPRYPGMHVYHFAPYEPAALKQLMGYYATREAEVDEMLRAGLFVDLHRALRGGVRASVESYSLKEMEPFIGFRRSVQLPEANSALFGLGACLELGRPDEIEPRHKRAVEAYNRDDCISTLRLRDWLENVRAEMVAGGAEIGRPQPGEADPSRPLSEREMMLLALGARIAGEGVPELVSERSGEEQARWVLANILDWHRREEKPVWWEFFRLNEYTAEELLDENAAFAHIELVSEVKKGRGRTVQLYRFPDQDTDLRGGEDMYIPGSSPADKFGELISVSTQDRTIEVVKSARAPEINVEALFGHKLYRKGVQEKALVRIGEHVADRGMGGYEGYRAARALLLREPPRTGEGPLRGEGENTLDAALRIAARPGFGMLPIQGPPGAGKTYTAAHMICQLAQHGYRVGITANSHKVIGNLLEKTLDVAENAGLELQAVQKVSDGTPTEDHPRLTAVTKNPPVFGALKDGFQVAAGTSWLWAREEAHGAVDVLFVDEAAQMSLADVLAISHAGSDLVLLGDPQQLDQPTQGSHPEGTELSALGHLLGDRQTIDAEHGLFLEQTWRLHPDICDFTSEIFYEGKLEARPDLARQSLVASRDLGGTGLRYLPVPHQGNVNASDEEAAQVLVLVDSLLNQNARWVNRAGEEETITLDDILIIAPYNAQVFRIQSLLPEARVGTVDKFQGQEAPVVIYSMATSTPEEAPRGMEFLYSLNRLNVATSRARCVCVLVASPALFTPQCRTPRQMQLANAFCRYRELAVEISL